MKWFKMDCDAQDNLDMRKMVDEWGWEWYGRYWAICGKIGMLVNERRQTFALQTNDGSPFSVRLLADDLGTTVERLTDFCKFLSDNRLIDKTAWEKKKLIFIPKMRERADEYTQKLLANRDKLQRKSRQTPAQEEEVEEEREVEVEKTLDTKRPVSIDDVHNYFLELGEPDDSAGWWDHFSAVGWVVGKARSPMKDWKATVRTWIRNGKKWGNDGTGNRQINRRDPRERPTLGTDTVNRTLALNPKSTG